MQEYGAQWRKARIDRNELARLSLVEKWPLERLQAHFGYQRTKIVKELRGMHLSVKNVS
jgi:hypothetical protein